MTNVLKFDQLEKKEEERKTNQMKDLDLTCMT